VSSDPNRNDYVPALGYRWLTPFYDIVVAATTRERTLKKALICQADIQPDQHVLDLACGTGTLSIWIKSAYPDAEVDAIDGDPEILLIAAEKAKRAKVAVEYRTAMSHDLPFPDAYFDRVVSSLFFHHLSLDHKIRTAREVSRILKPGGQLHVADWGKAENLLMRSLYYFIQLLDGYENTQDNVTGKLNDVFEQVGLTEVREGRTFSTMFGTMALYSAVRSDV